MRISRYTSKMRDIWVSNHMSLQAQETPVAMDSLSLDKLTRLN